MPDEIVGILKRDIPYDEFCFPAEYTWSLAFYKLCVLKHLCAEGFEKLIYLDTDVYIQGNLESIWREVEQKILLYDINHGLEVEDYKGLCCEVNNFVWGGTNTHSYITHYGGEFFSSNHKNAVQFVTYAEKIFDEMIRKKFQTSKGDEFIVSLAADEMSECIKNAGAYIYRFWTGATFRLVSTCYEYNKVLILHLPAEKEKGMLRLYSNYIRKGRVPSEQKVWKICRLKHSDIFRLYRIYRNYISEKAKKKVKEKNYYEFI